MASLGNCDVAAAPDDRAALLAALAAAAAPPPGKAGATAPVTLRAAAAAAAPPPAPLAARQRQARLWGAAVALIIIVFFGGAALLLPFPPKEVGFSWPTDTGLTLADWATVTRLTACWSAGLLALQFGVLRPLLARRARAATIEAVFFASSIAVRCVFVATLAAHHFGPHGWDAAAVGDAAHRLPMIALFLAAYATDLFQLIRWAGRFSAGYPKMVVPHHWLSLAWFGLWLALFAPRGAAAAPVWNTVRGPGATEGQGGVCDRQGNG